MQDALRISNDDGRAFIQRAPLEIWKRPFAPLPPPAAVLRKLEKERRRAREAAAKAGGAVTVPLASGSNDATSVPEEKPSPRHISHFVMNLPGSALEFLDAYAGSYAPLTQEADFPGQDQIKMPLVHVHCFTKEIEPEKGEQDILEVSRVPRAWNGKLNFECHLLSERRDTLGTPSPRIWKATICIA